MINRKSRTLLAWMGGRIPAVINPRMFTHFFFFVNQEGWFAVVAIKEEWKLNNYAPLMQVERETAECWLIIPRCLTNSNVQKVKTLGP